MSRVLPLHLTGVVVVVVVGVAYLAQVGGGGGVPLRPVASRAKSKHIAADAFRKGYRTNLADAVAQDDLEESVRAYNRAATGAVAERDADLAAGPGGYVAGGGRRFGQSGEFDRGTLTVNRSRTVQQAADVASAGLDTGKQVEGRRNLAQIAAVPGAVSAGAHAATEAVARHQDLADTERSDQYLRASLLDRERYDRGVRNAAGASQAMIAPGGLATGSSSADYAATRDRALFVNNIPDAGITVDRRHVHKADRAVNDAASAKVADGAAAFGVFGAAGHERALEDVRSHQAAAHHGVVAESHTYDAPVERHLQSDWVKANAASQAAIDAVSGAASGAAAKQVAAGFDQADTLITIANRADKRTSTDSAEFDDRHGVRAVDSKALLV